MLWTERIVMVVSTFVAPMTSHSFALAIVSCQHMHTHTHTEYQYRGKKSMR